MIAGGSGRARAGLFVGRQAELLQLRALAEEVRATEARLAVIEGEPGIGKTALIARLLAELSDFSVLEARGDVAESELRFGVLRRLVDRLPPGLRPEAFADSGPAGGGLTTVAAGAALLAVLGELQARSPVAIVIDDLQWADVESCNALQFALRRLWADRVLAVVLARPSVDRRDLAPDAAQGWARLTVGGRPAVSLPLGGLGAADVAALAELRTGVCPPTAAVQRLHDRTAGHPLWLSLVLAELSPDAVRNSDASLPIPEPLSSLVRRQRAGLRPASRELLDTLAVLDRRSPMTLAGDASGIDSPADALDELLAAGLVDWWPGQPSSPVAIRHPLLRDAIYASLDPVRRRRIHAVIADVVPLDESWLHRVAATDQVDAGLAGELENAAGRFLREGDAGRAATLLQWAAEIDPRRQERERYILTAAGHLLAGQQVQRAEALRPAVEDCAPSPMRSCVLGSLATFRGAFAVAEQQLTDALSVSLRGGDSAVAAVAARALAGLYVWIGAGEQAATAAATALSVGSVAPHLATTAKTMLIVGLLQSKGAGEALREFPTIAGLRHEETGNADIDPYLLAWRGSLHLLAGQIERSVDDLTAAMALTEPMVGKQIDVHLHYWLAHAEYLRGNWQQAASHADRAVSFAMADNRVYLYAPSHAVSAMIAAGRGDWALAEEQARASRALVTTMGPDHYIVYPALAEASIAQARSDGFGMCLALDPVAKRAGNSGFPKALQPWWRPLHVEGLIRTGSLEPAEHGLRELRRIADDVPCLQVTIAWLHVMLAESRGDSDTARAACESALRVEEPVDQLPLYRGLLELEYARSIASSDRRSAVTWLRQARDRFTALGAVPFVNRTESLAADVTGAELGSQDRLLELTGREREVAHVVAGGLTNAQAAKAIFVSEKTIEYHLAHVYAKLGIKSRRDLAEAIKTAP